MAGIWVVLVSIAVAIALLVLAKAKFGQDAMETNWPFYAKKALSLPEQALYFRLHNALPEYIVLAQVGLSRILGVKKGFKLRTWMNRIDRMSADFVICAKDTSVIAVIELDDASHERADRQIADTKKDRAFGAAGIRVIRWRVASIPDEAAIRAAVRTRQTLVADGLASTSRNCA